MSRFVGKLKITKVAKEYVRVGIVGDNREVVRRSGVFKGYISPAPLGENREFRTLWFPMNLPFAR